MPKNKNNVPIIKITNKEASTLIKKLIKTQETKNVIEATIRDCQTNLIPIIKENHVKALSQGIATAKTATIKLQCEDEKSISVDVAKCQYSKISADKESDLKEIFGEDYEECFNVVKSIELTKDALADEDILVKLIKAVGKENFAKYFKISNVIKPTNTFHEGRFQEGNIKDKAEQVINEGIVNPYKIAIRI